MELNDRTSSYREATTTPSAEPADGAAAVEETPADTVVEVKTGRTNAAQAAFANGDVDASRAVHAAMALEQHGGTGSEYIKAIVFGGLDGIITTFAVVASVKGADLGTNVVLIMGFANLIADGVSMGFGEFLSGDAENRYIKQERSREQWEMENSPQGEIEEMIELYEGKGFSKEDAKTIIETMAKNEKFFVDHMMVEELGMMAVDDEDPSPLQQGGVMFGSFMMFGFIPLLAYVAFASVLEDTDALFGMACALTAIALFGLGAFSSRFNSSTWYSQGLWVLGNGTTASAIAYGVGMGVAMIVDDEVAVAVCDNATITGLLNDTLSAIVE